MIARAAIILFFFGFPQVFNIAAGQDIQATVADQRSIHSADSARAVLLLDSARKFARINQTDSAFLYATRSLKISSDGGFIELEAESCELLASIYDSRSDREESLRNYIRAAAYYDKSGDKKAEAGILRTIALKYYNSGAYKKSAQYSEQEFLLHGEADIAGLADAAGMTARSYFYLPEDSLSAKWYNAALYYYDKQADSAGIIRCYDKLGNLYTRLGHYDNALEKYNKLLSVYNSDKDFKNAASVSNQVGFLLFKKGDVRTALDNFLRAAELSEKGGKDNYFLTEVWSNIAICHQNLGNQKDMLQGFEKALQCAKESGRTDQAARIQRIIAMIYFKKGDNYHAELYCQDCIESAKKSQNYDVLQLCYKDYSAVLESGNDFVKALEYYEKHLNLRDSLNYENRIAEKITADRLQEYESTEQRLRNELASEEIQGLELKNLRAESLRKENEIKLLEKQQDLDRSEKDRLAQSLVLEQEKNIARENQQKVRSLELERQNQQLKIERQRSDSLILQQRNKALEQEKIQKESELKNEKLKKQLFLGLGSLMVLIAVTILFGLISTRKKNLKLAESKRQIEKINAELEFTNAEVLKQKDIIEQKNQSITDSIQYASRIQSAVLPPVNFLTEWGIDNFILYKPKDIVSGDFYWGVKKEKRMIVAAGDCTGHGVPGAFMSMLGHAYLDEIVNTKKLENAARILDQLRDEIISTLKQKGTTGETRDGMDISLVILDIEAGKLDYAGANNPLYLIRDGKMFRYQADRMPIGIHFISFTPFTNQVVEIRKGDYLYLFSDGFADQFGGPKGRKFMYKPFQELLLKIHDKPMEEQKELLDSAFEKWKGDREQVDDVMVIGMRI